MGPFFVKEGGADTVWFCREGVRTAVPGIGPDGKQALQALALLSSASNGGDGNVYNGDGSADDAANGILSQFKIGP